MRGDKFKGTGVALVTPFDDSHNVDVQALKNIVNYQIKNAVEYLVVLGTTAENATLSPEEKELVKETIITTNASRLPLVLGIGSNNTQALIQDVQNTDLTAFDALLSVSPYYNKPTQAGIFAHFKALAEVSPLPLILYNVPGRTSSNISVDTVVKLAEHSSNIIGIKEAAGDIVQAYELIAQTPEDFLVISGDDMITLPMVLGGGAGVISVVGQGFPKAFSSMVKYGLAGHSTEAFKIHHQLSPAIKMVFEQGNPAGIKSVLKHLGLSSNQVRLPLVKADQDLDKRLADFIADFRTKYTRYQQ